MGTFSAYTEPHTPTRPLIAKWEDAVVGLTVTVEDDPRGVLVVGRAVDAGENFAVQIFPPTMPNAREAAMARAAKLAGPDATRVL